MRFKDGPEGRLRQEYDQEIHPDLRTLLVSFERWSQREGLPEPLLTQLVRRKSEQVDIYVCFWRKLLAALEPGEHQGQVHDDGAGWRPLLPNEQAKAVELRKAVDQKLAAAATQFGGPLSDPQREQVTDGVLAAAAETKFTWHWVKCAADIRTVGGGAPVYSPEQLLRVKEWFAANCKLPQWEFLEHDVTAPHIHVGRRDFAWRSKVSPS